MNKFFLIFTGLYLLFLISCQSSDQESTPIACAVENDCPLSYHCNFETNVCEKDSVSPGNGDRDNNADSDKASDKSSDDSGVDSDPGSDPECNPGSTEKKEEMFQDKNGACRDGIRKCGSSGHWEEWKARWPEFEPCEPNGVDEDCDGTVDNVDRDLDGDGFGRCKDGAIYDCCEVEDECPAPQFVNPEALEAKGNGIDDNCNGVTDTDYVDVNLTCDSLSIKFDESDAQSNPSNVTAENFAKSIGMCQGFVTARFANAEGGPSYNQGLYYIKDRSGNIIKPIEGEVMGGMYTSGQNTSDSAPPTDWIGANDGVLPTTPGCPEGNTSANGSAMFEVKLTVPSGINSFTVNTYFYSEEYPGFICSSFNDMFLILLDSNFTSSDPKLQIPEDKNLAFYSNGVDKFPVGVNLAAPPADDSTSQSLLDNGYTGIAYGTDDYGQFGLFRHCEDSQVRTGFYNGCTENDKDGHKGVDYLIGTGQFDPTPSGTAGHGGGSGWLETRGNVVPGEIITLRFAIWNVSDHALDSMVLIDNFRWEVNADETGTNIGSR